jgi:chemotaxis protein methyltransferase CheR
VIGGMIADNGAPDRPPLLDGDRLSPRDFERLARFVSSYAGIKMPPSKRGMLEGRIRRRLRALGMSSFGEYCQHLFELGGLKDETVHLIDAVTTNKTEFFREPGHFRTLAQTVLPELAVAARGAQAPLKFWSAGCSTGAEAYTIAMVVADFAQRGGQTPFSIIGTDICTEVLEEARCGVYPESMMAPVPDELLRRYVRRSKDRSQGLMRIAPELRGKAAFGRLNLMDEVYPVERDIDVVFCRNTLIYFDKARQEHVLRRLCQHIRPGGYLFLGHSETLSGVDLPLRAVASTTFRRL